MKKILCLILALVSVFALFSCAERRGSITEIVQLSEPTKIITLVEYVGAEDTLRSRYETQIDRENERATFAYSREEYPSLDENAPTRIVTREGVIFYDMKNQSLTADNGNSWTNVDASAPQSFNLNLAAGNYESYEISADGNELVATLSPDKAEAVLGYKLEVGEGDEDESNLIEVVVKTNGEYFYGLDISYIAKSGAHVVVRTTYSYEKVSITAPGQ